jgi:osmotically-inducible protein OsmY
MASSSPDLGDGVMSVIPPFGETHKPTMSPDLLAAARMAEERLGRSGYVALRQVSCFAGRNEIFLYGCLPSHYLKQVAQEIVLSVEGVRHVINRIIVLTPAPRRGSDRATPLNSLV